LTRKERFAEGFKFLLDADLEIALLDHQNNFVGKNNEQCKKFWYSSD